MSHLVDDTDFAALCALHDGRPDRLARLCQLLSRGGQLITYRTEGVLRGYLVWCAGPAGVDVQAIYVAPGWRRRGISRRLLRRLSQAISEPADPR